jgi:hypothetical protein
MMWFGCWVVDCGGCVWPRNKKDLVLVVGSLGPSFLQVAR